jgi:hypothetical protein
MRLMAGIFHRHERCLMLEALRPCRRYLRLDLVNAFLSFGRSYACIGSRLVLRHRRPVSYPYPNAFSHPLPQFWFSAGTKQILVRFLCDPTFPDLPPDSPPPINWQNKSYLLSSVPASKPRTFLEDASEAFSSFAANPLSPISSFFGALPRSSSTAEEVLESDIDLREEEVMEEDRGENEEADDSPEPLRRIRLLTIDGELEQNLTDATKLRRTFEAIPLRRNRASYSR